MRDDELLKIQETIHIKQFLSEKGDRLINEVNRHKCIGVWSGMNTGKTYFMLNNAYNYCVKNKYKLIIVIPTTSQLDQIKQRDQKKNGMNFAKLSAQYSFYKAEESDLAVITTPDSLPKIINHCINDNRKYLLCVDECHEIETSYMYRKAFKNVLNALNNNLCKSALMFSATFDNLILSDTIAFDKFINVDVDNKFFNAKNFEIMTMKKQSSAKMISLLEKLGKEYEQVFYKVDSFQKLNEINEVLTKNKNKNKNLVATIEEKENNIYLSSKNKKGNEINEQIVKDIEISKDFKYIGFTSLVNSGVEIRASGKIVVVNFANKTFNFVNEIQFIGRFRDGVELYIITIPEPIEIRKLKLKQLRANKRKKNNKLTKSAIKERSVKRYLPSFFNYDTITESIKKYATLEVEHQNKMYNEFKDTFYSTEDARLEVKNLNKPFIIFNENEGKFEIDEIALNSYCYDKYVKQLLRFPKLLLKKFKEHKSFNVKPTLDKNKKIINDNYRLTSFDKEDEQLKKITKKIKEQQELQLEENKHELQISMRYLADNLDDKNLKLLLNKQLAIEYTKNKELKKHLENWNLLREQREKDIYTLMRYIENISEIQAFKVIANIPDETELKNIFQCANIVLLNKIYNKNSNDLNFKKNKRHYKLKVTRDLIEADNQKCNGLRITNELLKDLFNLYIEEGFIKGKNKIDEKKELTKAQKEALISYLKKIYIIINENNEEYTHRISSLRKNVKDLISVTSTE